MAQKIKLTILYASENGKSLQYARQLHDVFSNNAFDVKVMSMNDFEFSTLQAEKFILFVGSTTGNGEPPENGAKFFDLLLEMGGDISRRSSTVDQQLEFVNGLTLTKSAVIKPRSNSTVALLAKPTSPIFGAFLTVNDSQRRLSSHSLQNNAPDVAEKFLLPSSSNISEEKPLVNVTYAVFALGCSAYPKFCNFGKQLDRVLCRQLGAKPLVPLTCADDLRGQDQTFHRWTETVLKKACALFDVESREIEPFDKKTRRRSSIVSNVQYRLQFVTPNFSETAVAKRKTQLIENLAKLHNRTKVQQARFVRKTYLQSPESSRQTMLIELSTTGGSYDQSIYEPGDHFGIFAQNDANIVNEILRRLRYPLLKFACISAADQICTMECCSPAAGKTGTIWSRAERLPACTLREAFTHYLDITTPPTQTMLEQLSAYCNDKRDRKRMKSLASNLNEYELWKLYSRPHLAEVFIEFPSLRAIEPTLLLSKLPLLQPRFYSISSSPHENNIHLTVKCVRYRTQGELGPEHFGVCSTYLERLDETSVVPYFIRHTPMFSLPANRILPIILIGAGTGIAPFRGFWRHRDRQKKSSNFEQNTGTMELYYGCRQVGVDDVYAEEIKNMLDGQILQNVQLALSKPTSGRKTYVQDLLAQNAEHVYHTTVECGGHIYVCGDATMATGVFRAITNIVMEGGQLTRAAAKEFLESMKMANRYHEDIFGVTVSTLLAAGRRASMK